MSSKITLITPPDFYENGNTSLVLLGLSEKDQDQASLWLGNNAKDIDLNLYFYQGENNIPWLFYALNRANATFVNLDADMAIINIMGSYILSKPNVYYTCKDENLKALMSHINNNFVPDVETFLKKVLNEQGQ
jgi:hypothetical protein